MYFGFDLYRDNSVTDLDERLKAINSFLAERVSVDSTHRHFGIFLLPPKGSRSKEINLFASYLNKKRSQTQYRLCIEFFNDDDSKCIPELELIYDLGTTSELYDSLRTDISAISYLCAYPEQEEVTFIKSQNSLSILFKFNDTDPNIKRIKNHLEFLIPNETSQKNN